MGIEINRHFIKEYNILYMKYTIHTYMCLTVHIINYGCIHVSVYISNDNGSGDVGVRVCARMEEIIKIITL